MADNKSGLKKRIMFVENPPNSGINISPLRGMYEVLSASTPHHAQTMIKYGGDAPIDLLVVKGEGSFELIEYAHREKPDAQRVYALTGLFKSDRDIANQTIGKLRSKGVRNVSYFKQPDNCSDLVARIKELIGE